MNRTMGRVALLVAVVATVGMLLSQQASAVTTLYWGADCATLGGTGNWGVTLNTWNPASDGSGTWQAWSPNDCTTIAWFKGTAGTVTQNVANIGADMLVFETTGYTVATSANQLWLDGEANIVATSGVTATILQPLTGSSGLNKLDCATLSLVNSGTIVLSGLNTYTGSTTIGNGILQLGANNVLPDGTVVNVLTGGTLNVNTRTDTVAGVSLQGGSITGAAGGILTNNTVAYDMQSGSVSAILAGNKGLNKTTPGTVTLSGVNTYTGNTNITAGTLAYGAANVLANTSTVTVNGATAVFSVGTYSDTIGGLTLQGGGIITGTTGVLTSTTAFDMQSGTVSAILGGSAGLNKTTAGTVTLSGANTYTGTTNITAGTLAYGASNAISTGAVTVDGATAVLNIGSYTDTVGVVTVDGGGLITGSTGILSATGFELKSGTVSAVLGGGAWAGFNKTTNGTVLVTGVNTIANTSVSPNVSAGTLLIGSNSPVSAPGALGSSAMTVLLGNTSTTTNNSSPALLTNGNFTVARTITTGPTSIIGTSGTLTIGGNQDCVSTFSGAITLWSPSGLTVSQVATTGSNALYITGGIGGGNYAPFASAALQNQMGGLPGPTITFAGPGTTTLQTGVIANGGGGGMVNVSVTGGTTNFNSVNTYTGPTTITGGTLALGINNAINTASAITINSGTLALGTFNETTTPAVVLQNGGSITGTTGVLTNNTNAYDMQSGTVTAKLAGNKGLTKTTGGLVTLTNANTYTGTTSVTGGTLKLDFSATGAAATNIIPAADPLAIGGATLSVVGNATGDDCQTFASTTLNVGASTVKFTNDCSTGTPTVSLKAITRNPGGTVDFTLPSAGAITTTTANTDFTSQGGQLSILGGWATVGGAGWAVAGGSSPYTVAALGAYSPTWTAGMDVDNSASPGDPGAAMAVNSLRYSNPATTNLPGTLNIASGGLLVTPASGAVTINNATLTSGNGELIITQNSPSTMTINSAIGDCATAGSPVSVALTKSGSGNLLLGSANSYAGNTYVDCGTLTLGAVSALPSTTSVVVNQGTLALNGNSPTVAGLSLQNGGTVSGSGTVTNNTAAYDLQSGTVSSALAGAVGLNKTTNGTVTLNTAASYTGATDVTGGTLAMGAANVLPSTTAVTVNGATLDLGNNQNQGVAGFSLQNNSRITGTGTSTLTSAGTINLQSGTVSAILGGSAGMTKIGNGFVYLNTPATYTGPTTLVGFDGGYNWMGGMLLPGVNNALPTTTALTVEAGAIVNLGSFNQTVQSVSLKNGGQLLAYQNAGGVGILTSKTDYDLQDGTISAVLADCGTTPIGIIKTGPGKVMFTTNTCTYTGPVLIANGILQLNTANITNYLGSSTTVPTVTLGDASTAANNYSATLMSTSTFKNPIVVSANATSGGYFIGSDGTALFQVNAVPAVTVNSPVTIAKLVPYVGTATTYIMEFQTGTGGGGITSGNSGLKTVTAYGVTGGVKFSNIISDGGGGTLGMLFIGGQHEMNNAANSYSGPTTIQSGQVLVNVAAPSGANGAFGNSTAPVYMGNAATTANDSSVSLLTKAAITVGRQVFVTDNATAGVYTIGGNAAVASTFSGLITLKQPLTIRQEIGSGNTLNITGGITAGNAGAKTVTFSSPDCSTNPAVINVRTNPISDGAGQLAVLVANAGNTGTVTFSAANTYTGSTTVSAGTLKLDFTAAGAPLSDIISPSSALAMGGGTLNVTDCNTSTVNSQTFSNTTIDRGGSSIVLATGASAPADDCVNLGAITRNAGATVDFTVPAAPNGVIRTPTANANFAGGQLTILGGYATVGGNTWAVSAGDGTNPGAISGLAAGGYNTGFLATKDVDAPVGASGPGSMSINSLRFNNAGSTVTLGGAMTVATGGILETSSVGNNAVTVTGSTLTSGNGQDLIVVQNNTANTMTIGSQVTGAIGLTKSGAGTAILGNTANDYGGATNVNAGTLQMGASNVLPDTTTVYVRTGGTLAMGANSDCVTGVSLRGGSITGTGTLTSATAFDVQSGVDCAILAGAVGLNKTTSGTVTLAGANLYTGQTNVTAGTLIVSAVQGMTNPVYNITGSGIGSGFGSINTSPGLVTDSAVRLGIANALPASAKVNINGGALEMMSFAQTVDCITLQGNGCITGTGANALRANNVYAYSGSLLGTGLTVTDTFYKLGPGTVTSWTGLASTPTLQVDCGLFTCYTGVVFRISSKYVLNGGTIALWGNNCFSSNSQTVGVPLYINGGTLDMKGFCQTFDCVSLTSGSILGPGTASAISAAPIDVRSGYVSAVLAGTAGLTKSTDGTVTLDGLQAYTGPTNVTGGTLLVNGTLFGSSTVNVSGDAVLGGSGVISGDITVNFGAISPGSSPGTLTVHSLAFSGWADNYVVDILSPSSYDNVIFKTNLDLAGTALLTGANLILNDAAYAAIQQPGDEFWIFNGDSTSSSVANLLAFDNVNLPEGAFFVSANGVYYQINYNAPGDPLGTGHNVLLTTGAIPEPTTLLLLGTGALGFFGYIRRRRMN